MAKASKKSQPAPQAAEPVKAVDPSPAPQAPPVASEPNSEPGNGVSEESNGASEAAGSGEGDDASHNQPTHNDHGVDQRVKPGVAKSAAWEAQARAKVEAAKGFENLSPAEQRALAGSHPQGFNGLKG
jgi:hypothetical protein